MITKQITESHDIKSIQYKKLIIEMLTNIDNVSILKRIYLFISMIKG
ncbi:hypothetical protein L323_14175 [Ruminiclostridium papyrosolvens C7]|uniref:Uncharacterized protein n=1 Tax=Ruminiclostridium papyrosolvens C7 TaxID=1330534 RepID=U4QZ76_9FIRM|nr:hypothetical protein L323_14175 [Ruminiclostridium papyrosolvens C7]